MRGGAASATAVAFKVIVTRPLGSAGGCTVRVLPRPPAAPLTLILPYAGRPTALATYLAAYGRLRRRDPALSLIISTLGGEVAAVRKVVAKAALPMLPPAPGADVGGDGSGGTRSDGVVVLATKGDKAGNFSRSVALREAVRLLPLPALFFVTDVDLDVRPGAVRNCRANAVAGAQVWYPIFFSLYAGESPDVMTARSATVARNEGACDCSSFAAGPLRAGYCRRGPRYARILGERDLFV